MNPMPTTEPALVSSLVLQLQAEVASLRRDLTACRASEAAALQAAHIDPLTGLPNRRLLDQRLGGHLQRAGADPVHLALLFIDLDGFKAVNDLHGHQTGDAVLQRVAARLRQTLRQDDLACRIGGDEFVCVLFGVLGAWELAAIADKLTAAISQPCQLGALSVSVRPSIGSAVFPRDGPNMPSLLAHADRAMYLSKPGREVPRSRALC